MRWVEVEYYGNLVPMAVDTVDEDYNEWKAKKDAESKGISRNGLDSRRCSVDRRKDLSPFSQEAEDHSVAQCEDAGVGTGNEATDQSAIIFKQFEV